MSPPPIIVGAPHMPNSGKGFRHPIHRIKCRIRDDPSNGLRLFKNARSAACQQIEWLPQARLSNPPGTTIKQATVTSVPPEQALARYTANGRSVSGDSIVKRRRCHPPTTGNASRFGSRSDQRPRGQCSRRGGKPPFGCASSTRASLIYSGCVTRYPHGRDDRMRGTGSETHK